jgi:hypothetical protein
VSIQRIEAALIKVAALVERDAAFAPVFERLESELAKARDRDAGETDVQRRARALLRQTAKPRTSFATCSSDAPLP